MPGSIFQENKAELEGQFLKGFLDDKIDECVDLMQEPFDFELVPSIQTILRKSRADQQEEVLKKSANCAPESIVQPTISFVSGWKMM